VVPSHTATQDAEYELSLLALVPLEKNERGLDDAVSPRLSQPSQQSTLRNKKNEENGIMAPDPLKPLAPNG
jgi:hypothetical protein